MTTNVGLLNSTQTFVNSVNSKDDPSDLYRFRLDTTSNFNLALTNMSQDGDVHLYQDTNLNNKLDNSDKFIKFSNYSGNLDESINLGLLEPGKYLVRVFAFGDSITDYQLSLSNSNPSDLLPVEIDVGSISGRQNFEGSINSTNTVDTYRINMASAGNLELSLYGMTNNADLRLIRDSNNNDVIDFGDEVIGQSEQSGSSPETISQRALDAGDYFVQVYQQSGNTDYTLGISTPNLSYNFTYYYGDGEYYKGYGYTTPDSNFYAGQRIDQSSPNETGSTGYYVIDSLMPTTLTDYNDQVVVTEYYDADSGLLSTSDRNNGDDGHLHYNDLPSFLGLGFSGLGSESGNIHIDGHRYGAPFGPDTFAYFNNYYEGDLIPQMG